jgi:hypothetical protein
LLQLLTAASGTKQTCRDEGPMSAFEDKADLSLGLSTITIYECTSEDVPNDLHLAVILHGQVDCFDVFGGRMRRPRGRRIRAFANQATITPLETAAPDAAR